MFGCVAMRDYVPEYLPVCGKIPPFCTHVFFPKKAEFGWLCVCEVVPVYPEFFGTPQSFSHNNRPGRPHVVWIRSSTKMGITKRRPERSPVCFGFSACAFTVRESMWRRNVSPYERCIGNKAASVLVVATLRIEAYHLPAASGYPPAFLASNASLKQRCV